MRLVRSTLEVTEYDNSNIPVVRNKIVYSLMWNTGIFLDAGTN